MESNTSGETMQSRNNSSCRCAHAGVIFSPPHLGLSIRGCRLEAIDTTRGYVMQQGSKEKHTVGLRTSFFICGMWQFLVAADTSTNCEKLSDAFCRCAHAGGIFSPPHLGLSIGHTGWKRLIQQVT